MHLSGFAARLSSLDKSRPMLGLLQNCIDWCRSGNQTLVRELGRIVDLSSIQSKLKLVEIIQMHLNESKMKPQN